MDVQDKNKCAGRSTNGVVTNSRHDKISTISENPGNNYALKARKRYTITKQRERWTDEEHERFLEAIKLYGRGWRQIEEHIGTKTTVQIRSHAQKYFSKVVKDPNGHAEGSLKLVEIPPPRPKKKPSRPYPRKTTGSLQTRIIVPCLPLPKRSSSPNKSFSGETESLSPTTVLSPLEEDENVIIYSDEKPPTSPVQINAGSVLEDDNSNLNMESKKYDAIEPPFTSIKLFGKTVLVGPQNSSYDPKAESHISAQSETNLYFQATDTMPWWAQYQGLLLPYFQSYYQTALNSNMEEKGENGEIKWEISCSGSSVSEIDTYEFINRQYNADRRGYEKGFMSY